MYVQARLDGVGPIDNTKWHKTVYAAYDQDILNARLFKHSMIGSKLKGIFKASALWAVAFYIGSLVMMVISTKNWEFLPISISTM